MRSNLLLKAFGVCLRPHQAYLKIDKAHLYDVILDMQHAAEAPSKPLRKKRGFNGDYMTRNDKIENKNSFKK